MSLLDAAALLLTLAALFGFINHHVLKLPFAIGLLVGGLLGSFGVLLADSLLPTLGLAEQVRAIVMEIDFADTVLNGMLSLLLFAGALHTDIGRLKERLATIVSLATVSVVVSAFIAGFVTWSVVRLVGVPVDLIWCLAFGALISPTDPIAVLGVMKAAKAPKQLEMKVVGESLFNDGTGVILFTVFTGVGLTMMRGGEDAAAEAISVALAMKLPDFAGRDLILTVTYVVVVFSIVVQGLSLGPMLRRMYPEPEPSAV